MKKTFIEAKVKKEGDDIIFVASDETLDRGGEVLPIDAWDLKNFKKNPVLLVNHDYRVENIVGMAEKIWVEGKQLLFKPLFHGITELSREVKEMVEKGFLNTVSVGFMPHGPQKDGDRPSFELFEVSFVPVPMNPSAERIKDIMAKAVDDDAQKKHVEDWIKKQRETTEVQTVICSKDKFDSAEAAAKWCTDHDFKADKVDETDDSYRFRQFDPGRCQDDSFRTIDITDGVKAVICRPKKSADGMEICALDLEKEIKDLKEGRVLSGKNRKLISDSVEVLKQAAAALEDLLVATESANDGKAGDDKSREPKVVYAGEDKDIPTPAIRALQSINRLSNDLLRKYKK